jgi:hypothetical protein
VKLSNTSKQAIEPNSPHRVHEFHKLSHAIKNIMPLILETLPAWEPSSEDKFRKTRPPLLDNGPQSDNLLLAAIVSRCGPQCFAAQLGYRNVDGIHTKAVRLHQDEACFDKPIV